MAEHGLAGPVLGVTFDGAGYGPDGAVWGGEFLVGDCRQFRRAAHLRYVPLPGGDQAVRQVWRMALAHLLDAGESPSLLDPRLDPAAVRVVARMIERGVNAPPTSSAGRLFDAVAALAGVRQSVSYEGQAAVELERLAWGAPPDVPYPCEIVGDPADTTRPLVVDTRPLIRAAAADVRAGRPAPVVARRFHAAMADLIVRGCTALRGQTGLSEVVLSGGVFLNALLTEEALARLNADGFRVHRHRKVPPNDGGLCLGQLAVAAARLGSA
jgi:hydrogenase maturation protein HypF